MKSQGITNIISIHCLGSMNFSAKLHNDSSYSSKTISAKAISLWTKEVAQLSWTIASLHMFLIYTQGTLRFTLNMTLMTENQIISKQKNKCTVFLSEEANIYIVIIFVFEFGYLDSIWMKVLTASFEFEKIWLFKPLTQQKHGHWIQLFYCFALYSFTYNNYFYILNPVKKNWKLKVICSGPVSNGWKWQIRECGWDKGGVEVREVYVQMPFFTHHVHTNPEVLDWGEKFN